MAEKEYNLNQEAFKEKLPHIEGLRERIAEKEVELGAEMPETRKEIVKEEIKGKLREIQSISPSDLPLVSRDEVKEIAKFSAEKQVEALLSLVFEKGLREATSVAQKIDNAAVIDDFHKTLADKYYEEMVHQGIIKI